MYDCNKRVLLALVAALTVEISSELIMVGFVAVRLQSTCSLLCMFVRPLRRRSETPLPPTFTGCLPQHIVQWVWVYWLPMTAFESCLFLLAAAKAAHLLCFGEGSAPSLLIVLLRDSVMYFGGVLAVILTNLIVWMVGRVRDVCRSS